MAKGLSIHIGLNFIDVSHYGSNGRLPNCDNDARAMQLIAKEEQYETLAILINKKATSTNVLMALSRAAELLHAGDKLLLTYSGHGSFFPDLNGDEADGYDETWVLYDRMLTDDELYYTWSKFRPGVMIVLVSDSCHSGTVAKPLLSNWTQRELDTMDKNSVTEVLKAEALLLYKRHRDTYDRHLKSLPSPKKIRLMASVILLAGCGDKQFAIAESRSGRKLSLFTDELIRVYKKKDLTQNYASFIKAIKDRIPPGLHQAPQYYCVGVRNKKFAAQVPFIV
ncbi:caspase family protein [Ferruginibacter profundus]